jgi:CARDB protein
MRRLAVTAVICLAGAGLAGAALGAPEVARTKEFVRVKSCSLDDHMAVFYARMRRVRGTSRMKVKFTLLERPAGVGRFVRVVAPGLSRWHRSAEGVGAYGFRQGVRGLHEGSSYRMRVRFRWFGWNRKLLREAQRTSGACLMFVPEPNLKVRLLGHWPTATMGLWSYGVRVRNAGPADADDVMVQFSVDGSAVATKTIAHLGPGESRSRYFTAPACTSQYSAVADPDDSVAESNEDDNSASASCLP